MSETTNTAADVTPGDDIDVQALVTWGLVSVIITTVLIFGLYGLYNLYSAEQRSEKSYINYDESVAEINNQKDKLTGQVRWLDGEGTTLSVPISRAKELTLQEFSSK
ncbi:hypothetical protein [Aeoliella mucimassa]|uniref:Uncharacterized protein n=1 Tax=Aeoliella mucimassa TaxID=2527972 RepID=A0A518AGZ0_9BACT|nr:hypothetical protein [Aeoliella mucimassa]QDU53991.1 hypothetical protein Pan181_01710 [Aeoliella mucimassa]